jgi:hypothetical protein
MSDHFRNYLHIEEIFPTIKKQEFELKIQQNNISLLSQGHYLLFHAIHEYIDKSHDLVTLVFNVHSNETNFIYDQFTTLLNDSKTMDKWFWTVRIDILNRDYLTFYLSRKEDYLNVIDSNWKTLPDIEYP